MPTTAADIRQYLTSAYSDEELTTLCSDYFREVYDNFAAGMTKTAKIQLLLDHCQRREMMPNLLAALERDRPDQYRKRFGPAAAEARAAAEPSPAPPPPKRDPRQVFISHAHEDADFAHRLAADLGARGWHVWIAPGSILPGEMWVEAIDRGLEESGVFVLVLTPFAISSDWVKTETSVAIGLAHKGKMRFIPAEVVSCEAPPLWGAYQCIPFAGRYESGLIDLLAAMGGAQSFIIAEAQRPPESAIHTQVEERPVKRDEASATAQPAAPQPVVSKAAATPVSQVVPSPDLLIIESPTRMELVRVPAGEFRMGSDPRVDKAASDEEHPQHWLILPVFYIGKYPVTNEQYAAFVKATRRAVPKHWQNGKIPANKENHPVANVSWLDAIAFCQWLSATSGKAISLPTEVEWEKAARGDDGRIYPWGNTPPTKKLCNFGNNVQDTTPVGQYPAGASPCGALDMAGNVWEWTGSLYRPYPYQSEDGRNLPDVKGARVVRGGSWHDSLRLARCAFRLRSGPDYFSDIIGFRVVVSLSASGF
jgi:formylglycine-generating enzyme